MTTTIFMNGRSQAVRLPKDFRLPGNKVSVRRVGDGVMLEPVKESSWPEGWFDKILIVDKGFERAAQGSLPPSPSLDA
jgi:virulence-associated protein VagC